MKENAMTISKNNKKILYKLGIALVLSIVIAVALEIAIFRNMYVSMAIDRTFIVTCVLFFVSMHFIIPLKDMYEFIYKKR